MFSAPGASNRAGTISSIACIIYASEDLWVYNFWSCFIYFPLYIDINSAQDIIRKRNRTKSRDTKNNNKKYEFSQLPSVSNDSTLSGKDIEITAFCHSFRQRFRQTSFICLSIFDSNHVNLIEYISRSQQSRKFGKWLFDISSIKMG